MLAAVLMTAGAVGLFQWEFGQYVGHGAPGSVALAEAQTMAVTTVIAFQIFYMLNCRSLRDSLLRIGLFSNPWVFVGIGALGPLQLAFIYAPPLQAVFGTARLSARDLGLAVAVGAAALPAMALEKRLLRPTRTATPASEKP